PRRKDSYRAQLSEPSRIGIMEILREPGFDRRRQLGSIRAVDIQDIVWRPPAGLAGKHRELGRDSKPLKCRRQHACNMRLVQLLSTPVGNLPTSNEPHE